MFRKSYHGFLLAPFLSVCLIADASDKNDSFLELFDAQMEKSNMDFRAIEENDELDIALLADWCQKNSFEVNECVIDRLAYLSQEGHASSQRFIFDFISGFSQSAPLEYLKKSADNGHVDSQYEYAQLLLKEKNSHKNKLAIQYFKKAAESNSIDAQYELGIIYLNGIKGVEPAPTLAIRYLNNAAQQGDDGAMLILGHLYVDGNGVDKSVSTAKGYFNRACGRGNDIACEQIEDLKQ